MSDLRFRIAHISDTHISRHGNFVEKMFDKAVKEINNLEPEPNIIVHTGDLTDNGVLADYEFSLEKLEMFDTKVLLAPGNHDERNYGHSLFRELIGLLDVKREVDEGVIFIMNSPEPDRDEGRLGRRRQKYLEENLNGIPNDKIKIVAFHHHLVPIPYAGRERNILGDAGDILETMLVNKVNLVLMGHRHVRRYLRINNTILINAGTTSNIRTRARLGNSFNIIDITTDGTVKVMERNLSEGKNMLTKEFSHNKFI